MGVVVGVFQVRSEMVVGEVVGVVVVESCVRVEYHNYLVPVLHFPVIDISQNWVTAEYCPRPLEQDPSLPFVVVVAAAAGADRDHLQFPLDDVLDEVGVVAYDGQHDYKLQS